MSTNPYEKANFASYYALAQSDTIRNRYEWEITHPALLQFVEADTSKVIDYGCGTGIFTATMADAGRAQLNEAMEYVGTDSSPEMLRYAKLLGEQVSGLTFQQWDACIQDSPLQDGQADRVFARLVLHYISPSDLSGAVLPRLRECLNDKGLLVAVLPNPLREVKYDKTQYENTDTLDVEVGNFGQQASLTSYHHTIEHVFEAANAAGFAHGNIFGLPEVRFEPYRRWPWSKPATMKIANPMPLEQYVNTAKRWLYVFGATDRAEEAFDETTSRFTTWRQHIFPEIADIAHMHTPKSDAAVFIPDTSDRSVLYQYRSNADMREDGRTLVVRGELVEHLTPHQKVSLARKLARLEIRPPLAASDHLIKQ